MKSSFEYSQSSYEGAQFRLPSNGGRTHPVIRTPVFMWVRSVALAAAVVLGVPSAFAQDPAIVGEVTLVIGVSKLVGADGSARAVDRGTAIRVGDRIETQAGGHVHVRFVDGGRLSVKPASSLQIEDYSHSAQQPLLGAIKFRLDEGVVRSITGSWGEAARDRFRLNTPVAAIGVKGTDFAVKSDGEKTFASVYTGAITLTPLAGACSTSVGPCVNGHEKLLSEDMKGQMLELSRQQATPQLVPSVDLLARNARAPLGSDLATRIDKPLTLDDTQAESRASKTIVTDNRAITVVAVIAPTVVPQPAPVQQPPQIVELPVVVPPPVVVQPPATTPVIAVVPVVEKPVVAVIQPDVQPQIVPVIEPPPVVVPVLPPVVTQLAWGRYNWIDLVAGDKFTRTIDEALAAGMENLTGNLSYRLFRAPAAPNVVLTSSDATANFRLASSTAQLVRGYGNPVEVVNVNDGSLFVDFSHATFSTQLNLANPTLGSDKVVAVGTIKTNGVLVTTTSNATIDGALTLDGKEAGYSFYKTLNSGLLRGVTLWGR